MTMDLDAIGAGAEAAGGKKWKQLDRWGGAVVVVQDKSGGDTVARAVGVTTAEGSARAAHIARMSPATTLALVAELRAAREVWRVAAEVVEAHRTGAANDRIAELAGALARALGREGR